MAGSKQADTYKNLAKLVRKEAQAGTGRGVPFWLTNPVNPKNPEKIPVLSPVNPKDPEKIQVLSPGNPKNPPKIPVLSPGI